MAEESNLQHRIIQELKRRKIYHFKTISTNKSGVPDIICCINGSFVALEIKSSKGKLSKLQEYNRDKIRENFGVFHVISAPMSTDSIKKLIEQFTHLY